MKGLLQAYLSMARLEHLKDADDDAAWTGLASAAGNWRRAGDHVSAAFAMTGALEAAWRNPARVEEAVVSAVGDCQRCIEVSPTDSLEALVAIQLWLGYLPSFERGAARRQRELLFNELANRLLDGFGDGPDSVGFLVRGVVVSGALGSRWQASVPAYVAAAGTMRIGSDRIELTIPSAFTMFRLLGDYETLQGFVDRFPGEFESPSLRGWKLAIAATTAATERAELYRAAADAFASDVYPTTTEELMARGGMWTGENVNIWSKFYRAQSSLARLPSHRAEALKYIAEALNALDGTWTGMVNEETYRLHIIVKALGALVGAEESSEIDRAMKELDVAAWLFGDGGAYAEIRTFLQEAAGLVAEFTDDPAKAIASSRVPQIQNALARLPAIGSDVAEGVIPAIGEHALSIVRGIDRSWVHRTLATIADEHVLQRVFLRLAQAGLPRYAQIRQGPLEYGKDVVVLVEQDGRRILRMYQMKIGEIDKKGWRAVKQQLEEIFNVPLETIHVDGPVDERVGFLVCNGHANPFVDPQMKGWFDQERRDHGHRYEFIHLDTLASWIIEDRLYGAFRSALREVGVAA